MRSLALLALRLHSSTEPCSLPTRNLVGPAAASYSRLTPPYTTPSPVSNMALQHRVTHRLYGRADFPKYDRVRAERGAGISTQHSVVTSPLAQPASLSPTTIFDHQLRPTQTPCPSCSAASTGHTRGPGGSFRWESSPQARCPCGRPSTCTQFYHFSMREESKCAECRVTQRRQTTSGGGRS